VTFTQNGYDDLPEDEREELAQWEYDHTDAARSPLLDPLAKHNPEDADMLLPEVSEY